MNALDALIRDEIKQNGPMPLARFMELALYQPGLGYYETRRQVGREGDFYTSVSVGSLFGEFLAFQFAQWIEALSGLDGKGSPAEVQIVEAGAHDGRLAADILAWLRLNRPVLFARLSYWIIEPSSSLRAWQQELLSNQFSNAEWFQSLKEIEPRKINGVIFSNELLDAMPVHRVGWDASRQKWTEWRVALHEDRFCWQLASSPLPCELSPWLPALPQELEAVLPNGFTVEISAQASQWWEQAAWLLRRGMLVTVDYGFTEREWIQPERSGGTLRSYSKHAVSGNIFDDVGQRDITADVNFSALARSGERTGLKTVGLIRQEDFLARIVGALQNEPGSIEWTPARARQYSTLAHPEHLGRRFRVLVQTREQDGGGLSQDDRITKALLGARTRPATDAAKEV